MAHQEFPKMIYHPKEGQKTVRSREEQDAHGSEWSENYADVEKQKEAAKADQQRADANTVRAKSDTLAGELEADADEKTDESEKHKTGRSKK